MKSVQELRHPKTNHDLVSMFIPVNGTVMPEMRYVTAIQQRMGCSFVEEPGIYRQCNGARFGQIYGHSKHNNRSSWFIYHTEPSAPSADVLTYAAIPSRCAALDIMVASPEAYCAGSGCLVRAVKRKSRRYRRILCKLDAAGTNFRPLAWRSYGRPHSTVSQVLQYCCKQAARRHSTSAASVRSRLCREVCTTLARTIATNVIASLPTSLGRTSCLLRG